MQELRVWSSHACFLNPNFDSSWERQLAFHHCQDLAGRQAAGNIRGAEEGADHTVFIDEDGRRRRHVLTVFPRSRVQHRNRVYQLVVMIGHDCQLRKSLLRLPGVIQTIDRNGDDAGVALGESVVMRFELT
jgi:hypothetical protein